VIKRIFLDDPNYFVQIDKLLMYQVGVKIMFAWTCPKNQEHEHYGNVIATHPESMSVSVWVQA
jgi:hypothetical protein